MTGFEAFGGDSLNPTELILSWVGEDQKFSQIFKTQFLPVAYDQAYNLILERPDLETFTGIICLGLAGGRSKISLERVGLNWIESREPDNTGKILDKGPIQIDWEPALFTRFNLEVLKQNLETACLPVEISLSAGGYVCNHLYFKLLKTVIKPWVLFIHVPYLQEQVTQKPKGTPFVTREQLKVFLDVLSAKLPG